MSADEGMSSDEGIATESGVAAGAGIAAGDGMRAVPPKAIDAPHHAAASSGASVGRHGSVPKELTIRHC